MAAGFDYCVGYCYNVFGIRQELCRFRGRESYLGYYGGWTASRDGKMHFIFVTVALLMSFAGFVSIGDVYSW